MWQIFKFAFRPRLSQLDLQQVLCGCYLSRYEPWATSSDFECFIMLGLNYLVLLSLIDNAQKMPSPLKPRQDNGLISRVRNKTIDKVKTE